MGSMLCCLRDGDRHDEASPPPPAVCCFCLPWPLFSNNVVRTDTRVAPDQGRASAASTASRQHDSVDCPPISLPCADPRLTHHQEQHAVVAGHDKASTQFQKACELGGSKSTGIELDHADEKIDGSSVKHQGGGSEVGGKQVFVSSDDEDDCPICLEEYDYENPEIILQCNHHYHLGCIYEWMERSQACPMCAKVMLFNENT